MPEEGTWLKMRVIADMLKISYWKLQRLVDRGEISSKEDRLDRRVKLVELDEVKRFFRLN